MYQKIFLNIHTRTHIHAHVIVVLVHEWCLFILFFLYFIYGKERGCCDDLMVRDYTKHGHVTLMTDT